MATVKKLISLDENVAKELDRVASALSVSQRELIESALDFYFDYTDGILADKITDEIRAGTMKTYSSEEVYKELGIEP